MPEITPGILREIPDSLAAQKGARQADGSASMRSEEMLALIVAPSTRTADESTLSRRFPAHTADHGAANSIAGSRTLASIPERADRLIRLYR